MTPEKIESGGDFTRLLRAIIERSVRYRAAVLPVAVAIILLGVWAAHRLPPPQRLCAPKATRRCLCAALMP